MNNMAHLELARPDAPWPADGRRRVLLAAVNMPGYYSLAVRLLALTVAESADLASRIDIRFLEAENTADMADLAGHIAALRPELVGFSVNIWNRTPVEALARRLRTLLPDALLLWGGQEATGSVVDFLALLPELDYLIEGEGEIPLAQLLAAWLDAGGRSLAEPRRVSGLRFRDPQMGASILTRPADTVTTLDELPSVILAGLVRPEQSNMLGVMLEGSRGCPNRCSFCFEGGKSGRVRSASIARLAVEADYMAERGAGCFHILDPILCNSEPERLAQLAEVLEDLRRRNPRAVISAEIYAHRVSPALVRCLKNCAIIDVGLQSANPATARAIRRPWQPERFAAGLALLREAAVPFNIYLICGLPEETLASFLRGITRIIEERPTRIFCNELCLLNGTELRRRSDEYGYVFDARPPYRVFANHWMSEAELALAQAASKVVEKRYNLSLRAVHTGAPWLPQHAPEYGGRIRIDAPGPCSRACPGCLRGTGDTRPPESLPAPLEQIEDKDVEITAGDGVDQRQLLQLLGHLQLYAPARLRLIAPLALFADAALVERLVLRGLWHVRAFLDAEDSPDTPETTAALANLARIHNLNGFAKIRPFSELALVPPQSLDTAALSRYCETLHALAAHHPTMLTVPDADWLEPWQARLSAAFVLLMRQLVWLHLPKPLLERALADLLGDAASTTEVAACLEELELCGSAPSHPPCFLE